MEEPKAGLALDKMVQSANVWIKDIMYELNLSDADEAYQVLRSVMQALRDRLPPDEAVHLGAQLPTIIRGSYYEGWRMSCKPIKLHLEAFFSHIEHIRNAPLPVDSADAVRAVFKLLQHRLADGGALKIENTLPEDLRELWPQKM